MDDKYIYKLPAPFQFAGEEFTEIDLGRIRELTGADLCRAELQALNFEPNRVSLTEDMNFFCSLMNIITGKAEAMWQEMPATTAQDLYGYIQRELLFGAEDGEEEINPPDADKLNTRVLCRAQAMLTAQEAKDCDIKYALMVYAHTAGVEPKAVLTGGMDRAWKIFWVMRMLFFVQRRAAGSASSPEASGEPVSA